jgi:pseudouridine synthase
MCEANRTLFFRLFPDPSPAMSEGVRINKYLASCGLGSRRACDALIAAGRVEINGQPCLNPGTQVMPGDFVRLDGIKVIAKDVTTIAFHKPRGLVCTTQDERGRDTIYVALPPALKHLKHVGRLDLDSEGLLILTNDGELSQSMIHPSKAIEKEYLVTSNQPLLDEHLDLFTSGVFVESQRMRAKSVERLSARRVRMVLETGMKRQIRQMFQTLGYQVQKLVRIRIGSLFLGELEPGRWQVLDAPMTELLLKNPKPVKSTRRPAGAKKTAARKRIAKKAAKKIPQKRVHKRKF